jgi:hypothetical protein
MIRFIILIALSLLITQGIRMFFLGSESKKEKEEIEYFVTAKNGVIGCLSKDAFREEEGYYLSGNYAAAQKLLDENICFFLAKGTKMFASEGTCSKSDKDDALFPFKPNDFMMLQPYLPCGAVR